MARKILLADDSVTAQNMGRKILIDAGYDVLTVNNGSAALKRIAESRPDLIVLDVYMPGYSGLEVCQRLKDSPETANIPVLLTVGKLEPFKPQEARRVKADAHIVKPFEASELLSAIARLEDGMVPQSDGSKFSSSATSVERFSGYEGYAKTEADADPDTGWKTRLRFPAAKKKDKDKEKEKPEAELDESIANYRDFRKGKGKPDPSPFSAGNSSAASAESGKGLKPVPDIPRDITPEELDALSALAAKLDEPVAAAQSTPSPAEPATPPVEAVAAPVSVVPDSAAPASVTPPPVALGPVATEPAASDASKIAGSASVKTEGAVSAPVAEVQAAATAKEFETTVPSVEAADSAAVAGNEVEIPVAQIEPAAAAVAEPPAQVEVPQVESQAVESQEPKEVPTFAAVNTALFAQEPAPIDQQDEPEFASARAQVKMEAQPAPGEELKAETKTEKTEAEAKAEKKKTEESKTKDAVSVETTPPVPVAAAEKTVNSDASAPSDEELAEALRLLTPATVHPEAPIPMPSQGTMLAVGQLLAEEAARSASAGTRWVAQSVGLTPEDAALSLEDEMFRTFASAPAGEVASAPAVDRVSVITAAVENRLAEAGLQVEPAPTEAPKAMAAAAAAESSSAAPAFEASASGDNTIASIVDSVLADLRPKIVEEIARKLSRK